MPIRTEDPWSVSESDYPRNGDPGDKLRFLAGYAVLAPSSHNTQPWRFRVEGDTFYLFADRARALSVVDAEGRELTMSCASALLHLRIALRNFGCAGDVEVFPEADKPDLVATVRLGEKADTTDEERELFRAITVRRTNRRAFDGRPIPDTVLDELRKAAELEGAWFRVIDSPDARAAVADLIAEGDRVQMSDPRFRRGLAAWMRPNGSSKRDGIPGHAFGFGGLMSLLSPLFVRTFDLGRSQAKRDRQLAERSPTLIVLGTAGDTAPEWVASGQALARMLLRARADDVWASFLNQPIEVAELRPRLQDALGRTGFPQLLLRMGYGRDVRPTPRRALRDVLF